MLLSHAHVYVRVCPQVADEYNLNLQTGMANAPMGLAQGQANYAGQQAVPLRR